MQNWYPDNKEKLNKVLEGFLVKRKGELLGKLRFPMSGIIVPHAGYEYSGEIAGKAYGLLKQSKLKKAVILAPSHYFHLRGITSTDQKNWQTVLGDIKIMRNDLNKKNISTEHAIDNQVPFLQKLGFEEILPILVGELSLEGARKTAQLILPYLDEAMLVISSDLSHFLDYNSALKKDKETIKIIENLDSEKLFGLDNAACGVFPLLVFLEIAKIKKLKPKLIEYKNSGDITSEKSSVVGYASFIF